MAVAAMCAWIVLAGGIVAGEPPVPAQVETKDTADTGIYVKTAPPGARISVDGAPAGAAPRLFPVPAGARRVTVTVELDGFEKAERVVEVAGGRVTRISFDLAPAAGGPGTAATPGKAAPATAPLGVRGTAEAFLRAMAEGRIDDAVDFHRNEHGAEDEISFWSHYFEISRPTVVTVLAAGDRAIALTDMFQRRSGGTGALGITLGRKGEGWHIRDIEEVWAGKAEGFIAEFTKRHPGAVEEAAPPAGAGPGKAAPVQEPGIRGTAEAFLRALAEGRSGDAAAYLEKGKGSSDEVSRFAARFDVSRPAVVTVLAAGGRGIAVTGRFRARDGGETGALGLTIDRKGEAWEIRDIDYLPTAEKADSFVGEFRKRYPEARGEEIPTAIVREIREVASRFGKALAAGDRKALEEFWEYGDDLDREAGDAILAAIADSRKSGGAPPRVELVHAATIGMGNKRFHACYFADGIFPGQPGGPLVQAFHRDEGRWRTAPFAGIREMAAARETPPERLGRRAAVRSAIDLRFGDAGIDVRIAAVRAQGEAFRILAGPPYSVAALAGTAGAMEESVRRMEGQMVKPWPELQADFLRELPGISGPEALAGDFFLLFYLGAREGEESMALLRADAEGTVSVERLPCLTEDDVLDAAVIEDVPAGKPAVRVRLTAHGKRLLGRITRENVGRPLAIAVEGKVVSAPVIRTAIEGGEAVISGAFTKEEAGRIAERLNAYRTKIRAFLESLRKGTPGKAAGKE